MNKFQTGQKWLRSDGKVCVLSIWNDSIYDQDGMFYLHNGHSGNGQLVSRVVSDDEAIEAFNKAIWDLDMTIADKTSHDKATITFPLSTLWIVSNRLCKQAKLLQELKQLISDSGEKGAAMIKKIEEL